VWAIKNIIPLREGGVSVKKPLGIGANLHISSRGYRTLAVAHYYDLAGVCDLSYCSQIFTQVNRLHADILVIVIAKG
jgi:hypothetical protein